MCLKMRLIIMYIILFSFQIFPFYFYFYLYSKLYNRHRHIISLSHSATLVAITKIRNMLQLLCLSQMMLLLLVFSVAHKKESSSSGTLQASMDDAHCSWTKRPNAPEVYFINMDRSVDRRESMERHLSAMGMVHHRYSKFEQTGHSCAW